MQSNQSGRSADREGKIEREKGGGGGVGGAGGNVENERMVSER